MTTTTFAERRQMIRAHMTMQRHDNATVDALVDALNAAEEQGDVALLNEVIAHASAAMLRLATGTSDLHNNASAPASTPAPVDPGIVSPSVVVIDAPAPEPTPLPDIPDTMGWDDDGVPCDASLRDLFDAADAIMAQPHYHDDDDDDTTPTTPAPDGVIYTLDSLVSLPMSNLRVIGARYGVKGRSKQLLAERIMDARK